MDRGPSADLNKYRLSRRGRKLHVSDDQRTLLAMPKDLPERTWAEILQKEENELVVLEVREELLDEVLRIVYEEYMNRQNSLFTVYCVAQAWLKLIDWSFYRHDPGEDPSAYPRCNIPKRLESWIPDQLPDPSPKDTWGQQNLPVVEEIVEAKVQRWPSSSSLDMPVIEPIPSEYWFPGKVNILQGLSGETYSTDSFTRRHRAYTHKRFDPPEGGFKVDTDSQQTPLSADLAAESEMLQKVTDYSVEEMSIKESVMSALKTTTPEEGSLRGAGDSTLTRKKRTSGIRNKVIAEPGSRRCVHGRNTIRSRVMLAPLKMSESRSRISNISDCRLRNLRVDTHYEISSERLVTPPGETSKRKP